MPSLKLFLNGVVSPGASHAGWALGKTGVAAPLLGGLSLNSQGVDTVFELITKCFIDQAVALDEGKAIEACADH